MACFLIPAGEAAVTTVVHKVLKSKEQANTAQTDRHDAAPAESAKTI